jgi:peptidoglycan/xylan/chitin deacetylase (PgdA/CDA1 family)
LLAWGAAHPAAQLFGPVVRRPKSAGELALTFDDGPNPAATPELLRLLDACGAKATFFLIGRHVRACPGLAAEIAARGHVVANHTDTHPALTWLGPARIREELSRCHDAIAQATGAAPRSMRPPYGFRGPFLARAAAEFGYPVVTWTHIPGDWTPQPPEALIRRMRRVGGGHMLVLHDGAPHEPGADRSWTLRAVAYWLPRWRDSGLRFVTLEQMPGFK